MRSSLVGPWLHLISISRRIIGEENQISNAEIRTDSRLLQERMNAAVIPFQLISISGFKRSLLEV